MSDVTVIPRGTRDGGDEYVPPKVTQYSPSIHCPALKPVDGCERLQRLMSWDILRCLCGGKDSSGPALVRQWPVPQLPPLEPVCQSTVVPVTGTAPVMLPTCLWSPNPGPEWPRDQKSYLGEEPSKAKWYWSWTRGKHIVWTLPHLEVSTIIGTQELVAVRVLFYIFSVFLSPSSNSLFLEFWVTWNQMHLKFAKLNGTS